MKSEDTKIRKLFEELRCDDESRAPSFGEMLCAADGARRQSRPRGASWRWVAVAAAVVLVGSGTMIFRHHAPDRQPVPRPTMDGSSWAMADTTPDLPWQTQVLISQWRSPTDSLLDDFR